MKKILVAVSGGISAYKVLDIISGLMANNFEVKVIATESALKFVTKHSLGAISKNYIEENNINEITHIDLARWCDLFLLVPATANTIAKISLGLADNLVTNTYLALYGDTPKIICPAMNTAMYCDVTTIKHIQKLEQRGVTIIEPINGLLACGDTGIGKLPKPRVIVEKIIEFFDTEKPWCWPLNSKPIGTTNDSYSYLKIESIQDKYCEIPIFPHVGSFGANRRHDIHKGIDLYAPFNSIVYAVEDGEIIEISAFTGKEANCQWWNDTKAIYIQGKSGLVVYGEIEPFDDMHIGKHIRSGESIGRVLKVLKKDKGRPTCMLHLELHNNRVIHNGVWKNGSNKPINLLDPTKYLIKSYKSLKQ